MKKLLFFLCLISSIVVKSQINVGGKHSIHYKSDLISQVLIQDKDYFPGVHNQKVIYDRPLGVDVNIYVDTIFKRYTITFNDQDGKYTIMNYKYSREAFPDEKKEQQLAGNPKFYIMEYQGTYFFLSDFMEVFFSQELEIAYNETLPNNRTLSFVIKKIKKVIE